MTPSSSCQNLYYKSEVTLSLLIIKVNNYGTLYNADTKQDPSPLNQVENNEDPSIKHLDPSQLNRVIIVRTRLIIIQNKVYNNRKLSAMILIL